MTNQPNPNDIQPTSESPWYIVRCDRSGVFFAHIAKRRGNEADLTDARMLWFWSGAMSVMELATFGPREPGKCKFTTFVPSMTVTDAIQIIPCSADAIKIICEVPTWKT